MNSTYTVSGMTCAHCVARVETLLRSVAGVESVAVSLLPPRATVQGERIDFAALTAALADTPFSMTETAVSPTPSLKR